MTALDKIKEKDPEMYQALSEVIAYIQSTYEDKYADEEGVINTKDFLYHRKYGKGANMFTVAKYINRYCTEGYEKSEMIIDLKKSIHYIIFELIRKVHYEPERINTDNQDKRTSFVPVK